VAAAPAVRVLKGPVVKIAELDEITQKVWPRLRHAADDRCDPLRLMAVATVDEQARPACRLLVLRGASRKLGRIWFHTDRRSAKAAELRARPYLCAVAYDDREQVQIVIRGPVILHEDDAAAQDHWMQFQIAAESLAEGEAACDPTHCREVPDPRMAAVRADGIGEAPVWQGNFALIEVRVEAIEWLQVSGATQRRAVLRECNGWVAEPSAPRRITNAG
jgi:pyridoxamine 5'-phosphate oxidase